MIRASESRILRMMARKLDQAAIWLSRSIIIGPVDHIFPTD